MPEGNNDDIPTDLYNPRPAPLVYTSILSPCARNEAPEAFTTWGRLNDHSIGFVWLFVDREPALVGGGGGSEQVKGSEGESVGGVPSEASGLCRIQEARDCAADGVRFRLGSAIGWRKGALVLRSASRGEGFYKALGD